MIPDRVFYPLAVLIVAALVGLALVWPQGQGAPSPAPFGGPAVLSAPHAAAPAPAKAAAK